MAYIILGFVCGLIISRFLLAIAKDPEFDRGPLSIFIMAMFSLGGAWLWKGAVIMLAIICAIQLYCWLRDNRFFNFDEDYDHPLDDRQG